MRRILVPSLSPAFSTAGVRLLFLQLSILSGEEYNLREKVEPNGYVYINTTTT